MNLSFVVQAAATVTVNPGGSIQAAINDANAGDTIVVDSGTYNEEILIDKQLTMTGNGWPVIDGATLGLFDDVVTITADGVHFEGFDVRNSRGRSGISVEAQNTEIVNNRFSNNAAAGIEIIGASGDPISGTTISCNEVTNNPWHGIYLNYADNNLITGNNASSNGEEWGDGYGITLLHSSANVISENTVTDNNYYGIKIADSQDNEISENTIRQCGLGFGGAGIYLDTADNTTVTRNTLNGNDYAVFLYDAGQTTPNVFYLNSFQNSVSDHVDKFSSTTSWESPSQITYTYDGSEYTNYTGNYWDTYTGSDNDGDGIGDTEIPFVPCSSNYDFYPLAEGWEAYIIGTPEPDTTPPASVTGLTETVAGTGAITWEWLDPTDDDFAKVMVYLDGIFRTNVTEGIQFYTATGLSPATIYEIGTRTVDSSNNVNATWVNNTAITTAGDSTPPTSVTGLSNTTFLPTSITWTWTDPADDDFAKVMVYLEGTFLANVTAGIESYTATDLSAETMYEIGTRTVDTSDNVNSTWVNSTATTAPADTDPPGPITNLATYYARSTSITWVWDDPADSDFAKVMVYINGAFRDNVTAGTERFTLNGLRPLTEYTISTHTVDDAGHISPEWVNLTTQTSAATSGDGGDDGPLPTPTPVTVLVTPTPSGLADLMIVVGETSYSPYKEWININYYFEDPTVLVISYKVTNLGNAISNATDSSVSINGELFDTAPIPPLAPGETVTISLKNWTPDADENRLVIRNDPEDLVTESDEFNQHTYQWWLCHDRMQNGQETEVDCGGDYCYPCGLCDPSTPLPERFDWRDFSYMTYVKDQGTCGSCWAFAPVGTMEGVYNKEQHNHKTNMQLGLSEADLVLCSGAGSCYGGSPWDASDYIRDQGIVNETCLPYQGGITCEDKCEGWNSRLWRISQIRGVVNDIGERKRAVACRGPMLACGDGHCVVIVGYDDDAWIIRNSWGYGWGDRGYATIPIAESNWTTSVAWMGGVYYDE